MMILNKARVDNKICDVVSFEEYVNNRDKYPSNMIAIKTDGFVLPLRGKNDDRPGIYVDSCISIIRIPSPSEIEEYSDRNIIDFNNLNNMKEVIEKQNQVRNLEREILTNPDNIFIPKIDEDDSAEMKALKEAVISKTIDIEKYESRFGANFNNDKRLFNKPTISLGKMKTIFDALDIKGTLILEDKSPDVPNPMGKRIVVELTGGDDSE
jgi:hypothetical protein